MLFFAFEWGSIFRGATEIGGYINDGDDVNENMKHAIQGGKFPLESLILLVITNNALRSMSIYSSDKTSRKNIWETGVRNGNWIENLVESPLIRK